MDYATTDNGAVTAPKKQKAKAPAQKRRAVPARAKQAKGQRSGTCRPPAIRPAVPAAYGFLKTRFLPHYLGQVMDNAEEKENFYRCFALFCEHYKIRPVATQSLPYPYCAALALHDAQLLLRETYPQDMTIATEADKGNFALNVTESYCTGNVLFYIPVEPLHYLMQHKRNRKSARLLLCIFSYLYTVAAVPYHTEDSSYLCWNYGMVAEWLTDDPEGWQQENYQSDLSEVRRALHIGGVMLRRISSNVHLERFADWVAGFIPYDAFGVECIRLAQKFLALWRRYPHSHIYSHADTDCLPNPEGYDDNDCITMEKYIGFVAATSGWLYESLEQAVNSDFNECISKQEPVLRRRFGSQEQNSDTLDYECRLFPLINELCHLLNHSCYDT